MNNEIVSTDLNSTENRKKPLIAVDRIDIAIHRKAGRGYRDIIKPNLPKSIQERIHKKSYARSATGVYLGRGRGSGFTNGTKLFYYYLNLPYEYSGKKAKYFNTKNQIPDHLMEHVLEINKSIPFQFFQLNLCEKLLEDIQGNLNDTLPKGDIEFKCSGLEVYFEIPNAMDISNIRERIYTHLTTTLTSVPITRSPQLGQEGPLQEWGVYLKEYKHKIPARITTYAKGNRIRIELKIDHINCRAYTPRDLISCLNRYVDEASEILTRISHALGEKQSISTEKDFDKKEFTRQVLELINGKTTMESIARFCDQISKDEYAFMPKPQSQYKAYYYFLKQMKAAEIISPIKASVIRGRTIQVSTRRGSLFSLNPEWQLLLKKAINKRKRTQRKASKIIKLKKAEANSNHQKKHKVTQLLQDEMERMSVHKQSRIFSILTEVYNSSPIGLPYPKTISEYLDLHSLNMYRLQNSFPKNKPNL